MAKLVTEEHSELLHYTTFAGLSGIIANGCLWATSARFLNDTEELSHFFDARLREIAVEEISKLVAARPPRQEFTKQVADMGGIDALVKADAARATDLLKNATLKFHEPFVFSMATAPNEKISRSGTLSQWRGYGGDGGYAIVFDSREFEKGLKIEAARYHYQFAQWGDVYYYGSIQEAQRSSVEVLEYEAVVRKGVVALVEGKSPESVDSLYDAVTSLSCLYKHWGFYEEQEVRVIAIPATDEIDALAKANGDSRLKKPVKQFQRSGRMVPYIEVFKGQEQTGQYKLPIKRVIVGPHKDKQERAIQAAELLASNGYECEVCCSEIPYIGH